MKILTKVKNAAFFLSYGLSLGSFALAQSSNKETLRCIQGSGPYQEEVAITLNKDSMTVKRGEFSCELFSDEAGDSSQFYREYRSLKRTCLEIYASGFSGESSSLDSVMVTRASDGFSFFEQLIFNIGFFDDLGANRPYQFALKCTLEK